MEQIIRTAANQVNKTGCVNSTTLIRALRYNSKHPMWVVGAPSHLINAYNELAKMAALYGVQA